MTVAEQRTQNEAKQAVFLAWHSGLYGAMARSKKGLPDLKQEMNKIGPKDWPQQQSAEVMVAMLKLAGLKEQRING